MNPLIPSMLDGFALGAGVLSVVLAVWAIVDIVREKGPRLLVALRLVAIILVPFVGALVSLYLSRRIRHTEH